MKVVDIVKLSNKYLAGEQLTYVKLLPFLDAVVDDINSTLSTTYPSFSDLKFATYPSSTDKYDFIPDRYIRSVICLGAATKFYMVDEEGIQSAEGYELEYQKNLYFMTRDFIDQVPSVFQSDTTGGIIVNDDFSYNEDLPFRFRGF